MSTNNGTDTALGVLGLKPVDLYFPCEACNHDHTQHQRVEVEGRGSANIGPCRVEETVVAWPKDGEPELGECECPAFEGALDDGLPRAIRMRMLSNGEWSTLRPGASMPAQVAQDEEQAAEPAKKMTYEERHDWAIAVTMQAVTHIRRVVDGAATWQPIRIVADEGQIEGPWDLTMDQLDRGGTGLVGALALALVRDYNDGGPFGGVVRGFRARRSSDVPPDGDGVQLQPARDAQEQT